MFTSKRITKIPFWVKVIKHAHTIRLPEIQKRLEDQRPDVVAAEIQDGCDVLMQTWAMGTRIGVAPCGAAIYFAQEGARDVESPVTLSDGKRGSQMNEGAK